MLISVIVPVYKVEKYLHRCVDSILAQTFANFELILVDDGSPDNCGTICDEYAKLDKRIHVIHQENGGLSSARNTGIDWAFENSDSKWLTFIDSDDWVHPQYLEVLLNSAEKNNMSISVCGYIRTEGETTEILPDKYTEKVWDVCNFFIEHNVNAIVAWGKLYKKECFSNVRYPVGKLHEDEATTYKILFEFEKVAVVEAEMYYYFVNSESIMNSAWSMRRFDGYDAFEERIIFFKNRKMNKLFNWQVKHYYGNLCSGYSCLQQSTNEEDKIKYLPLIELRFSNLLKKYRKELSISIKENPWLYEITYPRFMKYYWLSKVVVNKLRRKK